MPFQPCLITIVLKTNSSGVDRVIQVGSMAKEAISQKALSCSSVVPATTTASESTGETSKAQSLGESPNLSSRHSATAYGWNT
jgi:hypothetical protein